MNETPSAGQEMMESLCVGCGMCCDGTLHPIAIVVPGKEKAVNRVGLEVTKVDGKQFFAQPCPMFKGHCCSIYNQRPSVCRTYRCALLENVTDRNVTLKEARDKVQTARSLIFKVACHNPEAVLSANRSMVWRLLTDKLTGADEVDKGSIANALLNVVALDEFLTKWFRTKSSP